MSDQAFNNSEDELGSSYNSNSQPLSERLNNTDDKSIDQLKNLPPLPVAELGNNTNEKVLVKEESLVIGLPPKSGALDNSQLELDQDISMSLKDLTISEAQETNAALEQGFEDDQADNVTGDTNQEDEDYALMDPNHVFKL